MKAESIEQFFEYYKSYCNEKQNDSNDCTEMIETDDDILFVHETNNEYAN